MIVINYLLNFIIYAQPLFFTWLLETTYNKESFMIDWLFDKRRLDLYFDILVLSSIFVLAVTGFRYNYYTNNLLLNYVFLVYFAYHILRANNCTFFKAISLSFLLVFLNSYVWESVLHFSEYTINIMNIFRVRETFHLVVIYLLSRYFIISDRKRLKWSVLNILLLNFLFSILYIEVYPRMLPIGETLKQATMILNRFISLIYLLDIMIYAVEEKDIKGVRWWFYKNEDR